MFEAGGGGGGGGGLEVFRSVLTVFRAFPWFYGHSPSTYDCISLPLLYVPGGETYIITSKNCKIGVKSQSFHDYRWSIKIPFLLYCLH